MIQIIIYRPGMRPATAKLENAAYLIGSAPDCHIRLERPEISAYHAQLIVQNSRIQVMDLGSSNGTFINKSTDPLFANQNFAILPGTVIRLGKNVELLVSKAELKVPQTEKSSAPAEKKEIYDVDKGEIPVLNVSGVPEKMRPLVQEIKRQADRKSVV